MIFELLKKKGYVGPDELIRVKEWLDSLDVHLTVIQHDVEPASFYVEISFPPHNSRFTTEIYNSIEDAVEIALYNYLDYIPFKTN
jgi:hypothetical protein